MRPKSQENKQTKQNKMITRIKSVNVSAKGMEHIFCWHCFVVLPMDTDTLNLEPFLIFTKQTRKCSKEFEISIENNLHANSHP